MKSKIFLILLFETILESDQLILSYEDVSHHENWKFLPEECGTVHAGKRIVGGRRAVPGQFPWMARLGYHEGSEEDVKFLCGGSIINQQYVLTAAHCLLSPHLELVLVSVGWNCQDERRKKNCQDLLPYKILNHPDYNHSNVQNDISLIVVQPQIKFNDMVQPICLPRGHVMRLEEIFKMTTVAGWGRVHKFRHIYAEHLLYTTVLIRDRCACDILYSKRLNVSQICAGLANGKDSCTGDSGGPLMKEILNEEGDSKVYAFGVVSYGLHHCGEGPSVYTKVPYFMKWIMESLQDHDVGKNVSIKI